MRAIDIQEVRDFITTQSADTKIYIGADSERIQSRGTWVIDYTLAIVIHIDGRHGCKIFGEVQREPDIHYDNRKRPRLRLMTEVYKVTELYLKLGDVLETREVEVHLDINPSEHYGSSCVIQEAVGYVRAMCNVTPLIKPKAFAASYAADRMKYILNQEAA